MRRDAAPSSSAAAEADLPAGGRADLRATGPVVFARYAYPPNVLGYCGPPDPAALLEAAGDGDDGELRHLAAQFEGAWPYLELIAAANGGLDPLDRRVVRAYWLGNELALKVRPVELAWSLGERFAPRAARNLPSLLSAAGAGGVPQHSFHVFAVYPWLGLLRAGMEGAPLAVLDRCRIRWGRVEAVCGDVVLVRSNGLSFRGARLGIGPERLEEARRGVDRGGFTPELQPGDRVSLHWDWVCERLSPRTEGWLRACTRRNLDAVNALAAPGPAVACGV